MKKTELTCIVCPMGCSLTVEQEDNGEVISVSGNTCKRGENYGKNEVTNPVRTLTATVRTEDGRLLPVKTDRPIPKGKMLVAMQTVNAVRAKTPVQIGDVLYRDLYGADLVATANMN